MRALKFYAQASAGGVFMAAIPLLQTLLQPVLQCGEFVPAGAVELFTGIRFQFEEVVGAVGIALDEFVLAVCVSCAGRRTRRSGCRPSRVAAAAVEQMGVAGAGVVAALVELDSGPVTDGAEGVVVIDAALADLAGLHQARGADHQGDAG